MLQFLYFLFRNTKIVLYNQGHYGHWISSPLIGYMEIFKRCKLYCKNYGQ